MTEGQTVLFDVLVQRKHGSDQKVYAMTSPPRHSPSSALALMSTLSTSPEMDIVSA